MTTPYKKKLIEVAIPLEAINTASAHEKMPGIGPHPRGIHLWWARRPLAACRAVLFAQLVDDPSGDVECLLADPGTRTTAERELRVRLEKREQARAAGTLLPAEDKPVTLEDVAVELERKRLFRIIEELVIWENSTNEPVLERARAEIRRCCGEELPPVYRRAGDRRGDLEGTIGRQGGICLVSRSAMPLKYVREQGRAGKMGERLMAIVAEGRRGRIYLPPTDEQEALARSAKPEYRPEARLPDNPRDFKTPNYGMKTFGDLFTDRQLVALNTFSDLVHEARQQIEQDALAAGCSDDPTPLRDGGTGARAYAEAVSVYLGFAIDKVADRNSELTCWATSREHARNTFGRQALPMTWDFAESNVFSLSSGNFDGGIKSISDALKDMLVQGHGYTVQAAAGSYELSGYVLSTDPPYYDNIGYADLSDFFFVWLKPSIRPVYPELFSSYMVLYGRLQFGKRYRGEAHRGLGCTLIFGLMLQTGSLRALMEFAKNVLISYHALSALTIYQGYILAVRPVVPSLVDRLAQPSGKTGLSVQP